MSMRLWSQGAGIGFAIPMDSAWQVIKQLRAHRKVIRPYVGMRMVTLDRKIVEDERMQNPNFRAPRASFSQNCMGNARKQVLNAFPP